MSQQRGDEVGVYDADVEGQPLREFVAEFCPDLVGITVNTPQVKQAWRTAAAIKGNFLMRTMERFPTASLLVEPWKEGSRSVLSAAGRGKVVMADLER